MTRNIDFSIGEFYHLYSRGVDKRSLFDDRYDYDHFIKLLYVCNGEIPFIARNTLKDIFLCNRGETTVEIGAYCLMPNHFHILIREKIDGGISKFMQKLLTAYSHYFNKKYQRTGTLFESRFKAKHADTDEYLKYLFAYIHLNPVKLVEPLWKEKGIKDGVRAQEFLSQYAHSSYLDYSGVVLGNRGKILDKAAFPDYFQEPKEFNAFLRDWLNYKDFA
ncbi:MAG: transposase [Patescibacteria group bacterium]